MTRFELAASSSRTKRATGLRYIPKLSCKDTTFFRTLSVESQKKFIAHNASFKVNSYLCLS